MGKIKVYRLSLEDLEENLGDVGAGLRAVTAQSV
jgi:hypothetical protein